MSAHNPFGNYQKMAMIKNQIQDQQNCRSMEDRLQRLAQQNDKQKLQKACEQFEAIFIKKLWTAMQKTIPESEFLNSKFQDKYLSMFEHEFSREMAEAGGIGLSRMLLDQLRSNLEKNSQNHEGNFPESQAISPSAEISISPQVRGPSTPTEAPSKHSERLLDTPLKKAEALAREIVLNNKPVGPQPEKSTTQESNPLSQPNKYQDTVLPEIKMPVDAPISSNFGWRQDPFTGEKAWHSGIDLAVELGTPVQSCWPGEVAFAGEKPKMGKTVIIEHPNGWKSIYGHNSLNLVQEGQKVSIGQEIARSGNTGRSTGPHLHFELRQGELAWDPRQIQRRMLAGLQIGRSV